MSDKPKRSPQNPYGQVSIAMLKIWGSLRNYLSGVKNEQLELMGNKDSIDKMLIDMGIPVDMLNWYEEDDRNFQYAPIDPDTRDTLNELKRIRDQALKVEDYEALKELKKDMKDIFEIGKEIWRLRRELEHAVAKEDFTRAMDLKRRIKDLENKRDRYDALYETSRYEKMISLNRPSTAEYLRHLALLESQERMNADALRRQRELEEQMRRKVVKEEQNKFGVEESTNLDTTAWWDKQDPIKVISKKKKKQVKDEEDDGKLNFNNVFAFNEGDVDLELYLNPLLAQAGEKLNDIPIEILRRLHQMGYLTIFGARAWSGIHSENWRIREAVAQAVLNFLEMPLPDKYTNGKTKKLFLASMEFCKIAMEDKILQIYFIGLKILSTALAPPVCGTDVSPQVINKILKEFTPLLLLKIEELNYRARDISLHTLLSIFRHPAAKIGILVQVISYIIKINSCLDKLVVDPNFPSLFISPDKQPQRVMLSKLEVVLNVLQEFGYDQREFSHEDLFFVLATPCLFHPSNEVRLLSIEIMAALYQLVGQEVRVMLDSIENLKPALKDQILSRFDRVDQEQEQIIKPQIDKQLSLVVEQDQEEDGKSPLNNLKNRSSLVTPIEQYSQDQNQSLIQPSAMRQSRNNQALDQSRYSQEQEYSRNSQDVPQNNPRSSSVKQPPPVVNNRNSQVKNSIQSRNSQQPEVKQLDIQDQSVIKPRINQQPSMQSQTSQDLSSVQGRNSSSQNQPSEQGRNSKDGPPSQPRNNLEQTANQIRNSQLQNQSEIQGGNIDVQPQDQSLSGSNQVQPQARNSSIQQPPQAAQQRNSQIQQPPGRSSQIQEQPQVQGRSSQIQDKERASQEQEPPQAQGRASQDQPQLQGRSSQVQEQSQAESRRSQLQEQPQVQGRGSQIQDPPQARSSQVQEPPQAQGRASQIQEPPQAQNRRSQVQEPTQGQGRASQIQEPPQQQNPSEQPPIDQSDKAK